MTSIDEQISKINSENGIKLTDEGQFSELKRQKALLEATISLENERIKQAQIRKQEESKKILSSTVYNEFADIPTDLGYASSGAYQYTNITTALKDSTDAMSAYNDKIVELGQKIQELRNKSGSEEDIRKISEDINTYSEKYNKASESALKYYEQVSKAREGVVSDDTNTEKVKEIDDALESYTNTIGKVQKKKQEDIVNNSNLKESYGSLAGSVAYYMSTGMEEGEAYTKALEDQNEQLSKNSNAHKEALEQVSNMSNAFGTLNSAISEYNTNGGLTEDTLKDILSLGDDYLNLLSMENGQLVLNQEASERLFNAK